MKRTIANIALNCKLIVSHFDMWSIFDVRELKFNPTICSLHVRILL